MNIRFRFRPTRALLGPALALTAFAAQAVAPQQSNVTIPGGFLSACAYSNSGAGFIPGGNLENLYGASHCNSNFFSGTGTASATAAYSSGATANQSQGSVNLGAIHMSASNNAPNSSNFAAAGANGGWTDTQTIDMPGKTGQAGIYKFKVDVTGTLVAHGFAGAAGFLATAYKDNVELTTGTPGFDNGTQSTPISTDRQRVLWSVATYGPPWLDAAATIDDTVVFAVPIVFGKSFSLGVYAYASAGMRSSSGIPANSTAGLDFSHSLTWDGIAGVLDAGGNPLTGYTVTSLSGVDWTRSMAAPIPEPETYAMMLAGLGALGAVARRRQR